MFNSRVDKNVIRIVVGLVLLISSVYGIYTYARPKADLSCRDCNVLVVVIDPLRADAVLGGTDTRPATPVVDRLATYGYVFTNAIAVAPWTLPSAMSLFTGTYPSVHGVTNKEVFGRDTSLGSMPASLKTSAPKLLSLVNVFKNNGYVTGGFAGGAALNSSFGFDEGFDVYESFGDFEDVATPSARALEFIRTHSKEKMFVFLHGFDVHGQYVPPEGYDRRYVPPSYKGTLTGSKEEQKLYREQGVTSGTIYITEEDRMFLRGLYDEKVARMDERVGQFLSSFRSLDISRDTIVVFTSDHGDEFYEHGRIDHGMTLYDEVINIPLVISVPGLKRRIPISQQVRNIDIMPTLLDLVGIPYSAPDDETYGISLKPALMGKQMKLDVYPETSYRYASFQMGLRSWDGWKFIYDQETNGKRLYTLSADSSEQTDVSGTSSDQVSLLSDKVSRHRGKMQQIRETLKE